MSWWGVFPRSREARHPSFYKKKLARDTFHTRKQKASNTHTTHRSYSLLHHNAEPILESRTSLPSGWEAGRKQAIAYILRAIFSIMNTTSTQSFVPEDAPKICTYVFKILEDGEHEDNADVMRNNIQSLLGSDHEVISLSKMRFSPLCTDDSSVFQHVIKVKTNSPTHVATKFMGNNWVREDHILFKASSPLVPINNSENNNT